MEWSQIMSYVTLFMLIGAIGGWVSYLLMRRRRINVIIGRRLRALRSPEKSGIYHVLCLWCGRSTLYGGSYCCKQHAVADGAVHTFELCDRCADVLIEGQVHVCV